MTSPGCRPARTAVDAADAEDHRPQRRHDHRARGEPVPTQAEEILLRILGFAPHFQLELTTQDRMDALAVRVEAREEATAEQQATAAAELIKAVKDTIGVTVACEVVDPDTLEHSVGKLQRLKDRRT